MYFYSYNGYNITLKGFIDTRSSFGLKRIALKQTTFQRKKIIKRREIYFE